MSDAALSREKEIKRLIERIRHILRLDAVKQAERVDAVICGVKEGIRKECRKHLRNEP
jgi:hypothetical protein